MYQTDFNKPEHVHFIGIGGINMNGLAEILLDKGSSVLDSNSHETALTKHFEKKGVRVYYRQRAANIKREPGISVMAYTAAIHEDNPEFEAVRDQGLPMPFRAEPLRELMRNYKEAIAISRTHGKITTTSTLTDTLLAGDLDPTIFMGGILKNVKGNICTGGPDLFAIEACKYTDSFLFFYPTMGVILNVEEDHLNSLKDIEDIRYPFRPLADKLPAKGLLVVNSGTEKAEEITKGLNCRVVTFGEDLFSTCTTRSITYDGFAGPSYDPVIQGEVVSRTTLGVTGEHNAHNPLAAIAVALELGVGFDATVSELGKFTGTGRQFEKEGEVTDVTVIDDYVHHPQEVEATLTMARNHPHRELWCVFQPHIYTRTKVLPDQFAEALSTADEVILADIYAARETDTLGVDSRDVANRIERLGTKIHYIPSFDEAETSVSENCMNDDLLVTMGAGDTVKVGEELLGQ